MKSFWDIGKDPDITCTILFEKWIDKGDNVTWKRILDVLHDVSMNTVAKKLRKKLVTST